MITFLAYALNFALLLSLLFLLSLAALYVLTAFERHQVRRMLKTYRQMEDQ